MDDLERIVRAFAREFKTATVFIAVVGPFLRVCQVRRRRLGNRPRSMPSWRHLFGTDDLGRDVLTRVISGEWQVEVPGAAAGELSENKKSASDKLTSIFWQMSASRQMTKPLAR
jgi:hypothetical protein